jgi:hypothetical protein
MKMKRLLSLIVLALAISCPAFSTTLTGSIKRPDGTNLTGKIRITLCYPATDTNTGVVIVPTPVNYTINAGVLPVGANVIGNDSLAPDNTYYWVEYFDAYGTRIRQNPFYIMGATYDLGSAVPTTITTSNISFNRYDSSLLNYTTPGIGAITRSVSAQFDDSYINVKNYGAKGDGITDESASFQYASNYCNNNTVFVPKGTYLISNPTLIVNPCTWEFSQGTIIKTTVDNGLFYTTADNVKFLGPGVLDGTTQITTAHDTVFLIYYNGSDGGEVSGLTLQNSHGIAVHMDTSSNIKVHHNTLTDNYYEIIGHSSYDLDLSHNIISSTRGVAGQPQGIGTQLAAYRNHIIGNTITISGYANSSCISVREGDYSVITDNICTGNYTDGSLGISFDSGKYPVIANNTVSNMGGIAGIELAGSDLTLDHHRIVTGNNINNSIYGIAINDPESYDLIDDNVINGGTYGIFVGGTANPTLSINHTVSNNKITGTSSHGIYLSDAGNGTSLKGNDINNAGGYGIVVLGASNVDLSTNRSRGHTLKGISIANSGFTVTGTTLHANDIENVGTGQYNFPASGVTGDWEIAGTFYSGSSLHPISVSNLGVLTVPSITVPIIESSPGIAVYDPSSLGAELIANGDFAADISWNKGVGVTISGGEAHYNGTEAAYADIVWQFLGVTTVGNVYKVSYTVSNLTGGCVRVEIGGYLFGQLVCSSGTYTDYLPVTSSSATDAIEFRSYGGSIPPSGELDNFSVKQITGGNMSVADTIFSKGFLISTTVFASLGAPVNGTVRYCSDCTIASPCAGAGTGAIAKRLNGAWICN